MGRRKGELSSLDKFLVKYTSRVEREVEETKNMRENVISFCLDGNTARKQDYCLEQKYR